MCTISIRAPLTKKRSSVITHRSAKTTIKIGYSFVLDQLAGAPGWVTHKSTVVVGGDARLVACLLVPQRHATVALHQTFDRIRIHARRFLADVTGGVGVVTGDAQPIERCR